MRRLLSILLLLAIPVQASAIVDPTAVDLNSDGHADVYDLSIFMGNWGKSGIGDFDANGSVDVIDLSWLLQNWTGQKGMVQGASIGPAPSVTPTPTPILVPTPTPTPSTCDPNYSGFCVPIVSYDLNCTDIKHKVTVIGTDIHHFDADHDGTGCETY